MDSINIIGVQKINKNTENEIEDYSSLKTSFVSSQEIKERSTIVEKSGGSTTKKRLNKEAEHSIRKETKRVKENEGSSQKAAEKSAEKKRKTPPTLFSFFKKN